MGDFTHDELEYLQSGLLGRLATVGGDGTPHIAPVGMFSHNAELDTIDIDGHDMANTKKFRDVGRSGCAAFVADDILRQPWRPRGIEVRGRAEAVDGERPRIRIHPERIVSWGIPGQHERNARSIERVREQRAKGGS